MMRGMDVNDRPAYGIETYYRGIRFRSRLEARWAAFFDNVGWKWEYEPFDADGYIPDFVLLGDAPVLVEVKPAPSLDDLHAPLQHAIDRAGATWKHDIVALGLTPMMPNAISASAVLGLMATWCADWTFPPDRVLDRYRPAAVPGFSEHTEAVSAACLACGTPTFINYSYSGGPPLHGRVCGHHELAPRNPRQIADAWATATNTVRWTAA